MKIREYLGSDYKQLFPMVTNFKNEEIGFDNDKYTIGLTTDESSLKYIEQVLKDVKQRNGYLFIAEDDEVLAGFVMGVIGNFTENDEYARLTHVDHKVGWIGIVYVVPEYRGKQLSGELIEKASVYLKEKGCQVVKLHVLANNPAVGIYEKLGFRTNSSEMILDL